MIEKVFAGLVLAACAVMGLRLLLGDARRWRFDDFMRRSWRSARRTVVGPVRWWHYRRVSAKAADEVIRRARNRVDRDGNVYTPKRFGKDKKPH